MLSILNNYPVGIIEYIEEMSTISFDVDKRILIQVNPDNGRQGLEYFKIYNSINWKKASKLARIEFREPKYVIHGNMNGKEKWFLNSREKKDLIELLNTYVDDKFTVWQQTILQFNLEKGLLRSQTMENLLSSKKLKYPLFLPFDLPMPDYMKL